MLQHQGGRFLHLPHQPKAPQIPKNTFRNIWPRHPPTKHLWHGRAKFTQWSWSPYGMHVDVAMHVLALSFANLNLFVLISTTPPFFYGAWALARAFMVLTLNSAIEKVEMQWRISNLKTFLCLNDLTSEMASKFPSYVWGDETTLNFIRRLVLRRPLYP